MKSEFTLVLLKPDIVERNLIGKVLSIYEENNLKITNLKLLTPTKEMASEHYIEHKNKPFFNELIDYLTSGPLVAVILEGDNAVFKVRKLNGNTSPKEGEVSIRSKFAINTQKNSVHGSDSIESAQREINIWFN